MGLPDLTTFGCQENLDDIKSQVGDHHGLNSFSLSSLFITRLTHDIYLVLDL